MMNDELLLLEFLRRLPMPILVFHGESGTVHLANPAFQEMFGEEGVDLPVRLDLWWMQAFPDPAYRSAVMGDWNARVIRTRARGEETLPVDARVTVRTGQVRPMSMLVEPAGEWTVLTLMDAPGEPATESETSRHDELTGLPNAAAFREYLERQLELSQRHRQSLSLVVLDIDQLVQIEGLHGTSVRKAAVLHVMNLIRATVRSSDFLARMSAGEFALLLPATDLPRATMLAERLRRKIEGDALRTEAGSEVRLSVHCGIADAQTAGYEAQQILTQVQAALRVSARV